MEIFHQRSHIHDGLKHLSEKEIILKVREAPTKLKSAAKSLLRKLRKHNVTLTPAGDVDYSAVQQPNVVNTLKKHDDLVKLTLMQADLEFEYPQKLEKLMIKADILRLVEEEESKMRLIVAEKEAERARKTDLLTYEEYYDTKPELDS